MMYWPVAKEIPFLDISIFAFVAMVKLLISFVRSHHKEHFCYFEFGQVFQEERSFKDNIGLGLVVQ